jgi:hypothetical protein
MGSPTKSNMPHFLITSSMAPSASYHTLSVSIAPTHQSVLPSIYISTPFHSKAPFIQSNPSGQIRDPRPPPPPHHPASKKILKKSPYPYPNPAYKNPPYPNPHRSRFPSPLTPPLQQPPEKPYRPPSTVPASTPAPIIPPSLASRKKTLFPLSCGPSLITSRSINRWHVSFQCG